MLWAILAVLAGLGDATVYAFMKRLKKLDASLVVWIEHAFSVPFLLAMLYFFFPDNIHKGVYLVGPINALLLALTMLLLFKAFSSSNLSITVPLLCLTPLFLLFTSLIMLHEAPSYPFGYVGVILIVVGTYALNINLKKKKFFEPFRALYYNPGSRLAIGAAFMMSIMANMFKIGINYSNPFFYSAFVHSMVAAFLFPFLFIKCRRKLNQLKENLKSALIIGFASGFMAIMAGLALLTAIVPYMISLKRSSVIFGMAYSHFFFREENVKFRLLGAVIMLIGAVLIVVS